MKTLEDLKAVCAASESTSVNDAYIDFVKTFTPKLVSVLLDELVAGRAFQYHHYSEPSIFADEFYQARERTEAVLRGE